MFSCPQLVPRQRSVRTHTVCSRRTVSMPPHTESLMHVHVNVVSDCGIFALMFAEAVCSAHLKPDPPSSSSSSPPPPLPSTAVSREGVLGKREELKALIASLAAI